MRAWSSQVRILRTSKERRYNMNYYTLPAVEKTACNNQDHGLIKEIKVTKITELDFNNMEGQNYQINLKLVTVDGYKNKLLKCLTNSTYLDDWEDTQTLQEYLEEYLNGLL